jgi:hypothetical protein
MTHYLAMTNSLSISLSAVSVAGVLFTPIVGGNVCYPTDNKLHIAYSTTYVVDIDEKMRCCESSALGIYVLV